jgi:hypothetical protein
LSFPFLDTSDFCDASKAQRKVFLTVALAGEEEYCQDMEEKFTVKDLVCIHVALAADKRNLPVDIPEIVRQRAIRNFENARVKCAAMLGLKGVDVG